MNNEEKKCCFANPSKKTYSCRILTIEACDGFNTNCLFFKTEDKFNSDRDNAIDICREKGICWGCKYSKMHCCIKSDEC